MAKNNLHIVYTLEDIEKYFKDTLSATERHLMEKAALSDPFLADAIEGYENTYLVSAKEHLADISSKLSPKLEQKEYALTDIERYLQGNMTAAEMHAMEKAALKDPFLADAMEGFAEVDFTQAKQQLHIVSDRISANEETSTNYNFNDIEQYIEGNMPPTERHALERTALKEPFLSDAIEGYEQTNLSVAKQHLTNIETAILGEEKEDTKVVAMNASSSNKMWLRIAAAVIIMIGVGTTVWLTNSTPEQSKEIAQVTTIKQDDKIQSLPQANDQASIKTNSVDTQPLASTGRTGTKGTSITIVQADKKQLETAAANSNRTPKQSAALPSNPAYNWNSGTEDAAAKTAEPKKNDNKDAASFSNDYTLAKTKQDSVNAVANDFLREKAKKEAIAQNKSMNTNLERYKNASASKPAPANTNAAPYYNNSNTASNQLRGNVVNSNGEPVPFAKVELNRNSRNLSTIRGDANGGFNYYSADTTLTANIAAQGYATQNATISANTNNTIVLQRASNYSLADDVVTESIGKKRKQETSTEATLGKPVGGIKSFEDYVSKKKETLKKDSTEEEYVEGLVELEFDVDRLGKPYNISVTNSNTVNAETSNKAIQIVKEGPAWIADKKKKKAKVIIKL